MAALPSDRNGGGSGSGTAAIPDGYVIRDVPIGDGGGAGLGRREPPARLKPSLRKAASERIKLRQRLLTESLNSSHGSNLDLSRTSQRSLNTTPDVRLHMSRSYSGSCQSTSTQNEVRTDVNGSRRPSRNGCGTTGSSVDVLYEDFARDESCLPMGIEERRGSMDVVAGAASCGAIGNGSDTTSHQSCSEAGNNVESTLYEDFGFNNTIRRIGRRSSMPTLTGNFTPRECNEGVNYHNGIMDDYIALKLRVAELQSELQVEQSRVQRYVEGLELAFKEMTKMRDRNSKLEGENRLLLHSFRELERAGRLEGMEGVRRLLRERRWEGGMGEEREVDLRRVPLIGGKKRSFSWGMLNLDWGELDPAADEKETDKPSRPRLPRRPSWWKNRRSSAEEVHVSDNSDAKLFRRSAVGENTAGVDRLPQDGIVIRNQPLEDARRRKSFEEDRTATTGPASSWKRRSSGGSGGSLGRGASLAEAIRGIPRSLSRSRIAQEDGRNDNPTKAQKSVPAQAVGLNCYWRPRRQAWRQRHPKEGAEGGDDLKPAVPEYVHFLDSDCVDLRCSEISFDGVPIASAVASREAPGRLDAENALSGIDERRPGCDEAPIATTSNGQGGECDEVPDSTATDEGENVDHGPDGSDSTRNRCEIKVEGEDDDGDSGSYALWHKDGALGYSMNSNTQAGSECRSPRNGVRPRRRVSSTRVGGGIGEGSAAAPPEAESPWQQYEPDSVDDEHWTPSVFAFSSVGTPLPA